jgi:hypothetical protein
MSVLLIAIATSTGTYMTNSCSQAQEILAKCEEENKAELAEEADLRTKFETDLQELKVSLEKLNKINIEDIKKAVKKKKKK